MASIPVDGRLRAGRSKLAAPVVTASSRYNLGTDAYNDMAIGTSWAALTPGVIGTGNTGYGNNTAIGAGALAAETTPNSQTAIGYQALNAITNGKVNVAIGYRAMGSATSGMNNVAVGGNALQNVQGVTGNSFIGAFNVAVGDFAGNTLTTGWSNTFIGAACGQNFVAGEHNVGVGETLENVGTPINHNTAVGGLALMHTQTDGSTAIGYDALNVNTTGTDLVAVGLGALQANSSGADSTAVGYNALNHNQTGSGNTAIGSLAMFVGTAVASSTAIGFQSLYNAIGVDNTAVGYNALQAITTGTANVGMGRNAGLRFTSGANCTFIGYNAGNTDGTNLSNNVNRATCIGEQAQAQVNDVIVLGKAIATRPNLIFGGVGAAAAFGGGVGVFAIANVATAPTTNPTGGGVLYASAGALVWKGSSGTVTTIAVA